MKGVQKHQKTKMIDFISQLYKKYTVLNRLTDEQSNNFQTEAISLLIDQNQNLDKQTYSQVVDKIGLGNFILDLLGNAISRNKFKNQYEMNRNISEITQQLSIKKIELDKKQKLLERKEAKAGKTESELLDRIREFAIRVQKETVNKFTAKQVEIKRNVNAEMHKLKTRQKILQDKLDEIKKSLAKISGLENKQKSVEEKIKLLERRQKEWKEKEVQRSLAKFSEQEAKQVKRSNDKLHHQLKEMSNKLRNSDMAYRKIKNDYQAKEQLLRQLRISYNQRNEELHKLSSELNSCRKKSKQANSIHSLHMENLEISRIQTSEPNSKETDVLFEEIQDLEQRCSQMFQIIHQFLSCFFNCFTKLEDFDKFKLMLISEYKTRSRKMPQQIKNINDTDYLIDIETHLVPESYPEPSFQLDLGRDSQFSEGNSLIKEIDSIYKLQGQDILSLISTNRIVLLAKSCAEQHKYQKQTVIAVLDLIVSLLEQSPDYNLIIEHLSDNGITKFLQESYLRYEMNAQIAESVTLILSRIVLSQRQFAAIDQFRKAIQICHRMGKQASGILMSNVKCLAENFDI